MFGRITALLIKEWHSIWRDKKTRFVLIVPPLVQLIIFSFAATLDVKNVSIGVLNRDHGEQSIELLQRFHGSPTFRHITYLQSIEDIEPFIDNQKGVGVLSIDQQFSRNLDAHKKADVQFILDGRKSNASQIVAGYASNIVEQFNNDFAAKQNIQLQTTELVPRNWYNPNLLYYWYTVPSLCGILTLLEALILTSLSIARERELGTFDQLLVSPIEPIEILIGKAIPAILVSIAEGSFIIFAAVFIFQIPFTGSLLNLYGGMFVFVCCIVGVGLFISSLCSTQQQAILGSSLFLTPAVTLSGFATPIENMPSWLQPFTLLNPLRYFLVIVKGVFLKEMPWHIILTNLWPMAIIAFFTLSAATWLFKRRLE